MWVSFPGLRGWWRSWAEKCPRSPRGEAAHSRLRVRAVEAPVQGGRMLSLTSCWGSGCWRWWVQAPPWGPHGLRKGSIRSGTQETAPMLEASGGEIPRCDPEGVPDHLECLPGHSRPHHLHHRSVPLPRLWHMGLHGCALSVTRPSCLLIPTAVHWYVSLRRANLGPAPLPFTIFCPPTLSRVR